MSTSTLAKSPADDFTTRINERTISAEWVVADDGTTTTLAVLNVIHYGRHEYINRGPEYCFRASLSREYIETRERHPNDVTPGGPTTYSVRRVIIGVGQNNTLGVAQVEAKRYSEKKRNEVLEAAINWLREQSDLEVVSQFFEVTA